MAICLCLVFLWYKNHTSNDLLTQCLMSPLYVQDRWKYIFFHFTSMYRFLSLNHVDLRIANDAIWVFSGEPSERSLVFQRSPLFLWSYFCIRMSYPDLLISSSYSAQKWRMDFSLVQILPLKAGVDVIE